MKQFICEKCGHYLSGDQYPGSEEPKIVAHCDVPMKFVFKQPDRVRKINAVFDYYHQVYRDTEGKLVSEELNWDFPCPKCHGPSELVSCNTYFEEHKCLECGYDFKVN